VCCNFNRVCTYYFFDEEQCSINEVYVNTIAAQVLILQGGDGEVMMKADVGEVTSDDKK
jgi:hypothetical protein